MPAGGPSPQEIQLLHQLEDMLKQHGYQYDADELHHFVVRVITGDLTMQQALKKAVNSGAAWQQGQGGGGGGNPPGPGSPPGSPGSGSSSGSSSSGSSGSSAPPAPDFAAIMAEYRSLLRSWGIKVDGNIQKLMENAAHRKVNGNWASMTMTQFMQAVRKTSAYHHEFVGIQNFPHMTEEEYIAQSRQYGEIADQNHIDLNKDKIKFLFKNGVSVSEFSDRSQAYQTLQHNKSYFDAFKDQIKAMGGKPPTDKHLFNWILSKGESNKEWTRLWDAAAVRYSAQEQGFDISKHGNKGGDLGLSNKQVMKISQKTGADVSVDTLSQLADTLSAVLPEARFGDWGLSKQDIIEAEFGGSRSAAARQKIKDLVDYMNNRAASTYGATQTQAGSRGLASQQRAQGL